MSPNRGILDVADPPTYDGRYNRRGGKKTWYGSSSEAGAWAELVRNPVAGVDLTTVRRRVGSATFELVALDLTNPSLLKSLGVTLTDLTSDNRRVCQEIAEIAVDQGFEGVLGPSAASAADTTLAVFGEAIRDRAREVVDKGVRTPPITLP